MIRWSCEKPTVTFKEPASLYPKQRACAPPQRRVRHHAGNTDPYKFFNLLTGPDLLDEVEALLPEHRERLFPPTETLSMFLAQAMNADRCCQNVVNDTAVQRLSGGLPHCSTATGGYFVHANNCQ